MEASGELHRRKLFAGIAMIAAPLLVAIAYLIGPSLQRDVADQMAALADAPGRMNAALIVGLIGLALFVYAALGLAHLLREERPWLGQIGGLLAVTGLLFIGVTEGAYIAATEAAQLDVAAATATFDNVMGNPVMILAIAGSAAAAVGFVVLAIGLLLARTAPMWSAVLLGIGSVVQWSGITFASTPLTIVGFGLVFVGLAPLGYGLFSEPDEAWEHPVHFEGFHPTTAH